MPRRHINDADAKAQRNRNKASNWSRALYAQAAEIAPIPECQNLERRKSTKSDLLAFCKTYGESIFTLPWSKYHMKCAELAQSAAIDGGLFAFAMPRGSGKTSMCEFTALWAICHGHCQFVVLIGASEPTAEKRLKSIKAELRHNPLLLEDFPEICYPIKCCGPSPEARAKTLTYRGESAGMEWTKEFLALANLPGRRDIGGVFAAKGITGEIRGMTHKAAGQIIRPDLAIADDPQTRKSAQSETMSKTRADTLAADVAYLNGPGKAIAVMVPCTVIYQQDMADQILDRDLHPEYRGIRTRMVEKFPSNEAKWDEYGQLLKDSVRNDGDGEVATKFYEENREEMDRGSEVTWPERFGQNWAGGREISAIQHAMNLKIRDESAFWSEMQNEPVENFDDSGVACLPKDVFAKVTGYFHYQVPPDAAKIVSFVDIQGSCLYYGTCAFMPGFSGSLVDYQTWPNQPGGYRNFALSNIRETFERAYGANMQPTQWVYRALAECCTWLTDRRYLVDGGGELRHDRILIDANWGEMRDVVYQFCNEHTLGVQIDPSHGKYVGAKTQPWSEWKRKTGETVGPHWRYRSTEDWPVKHVLIDANHWKTFVHRRMKADFGGNGCFSIYGHTERGRRVSEKYHQDFASQFCAEYGVETEGRGRRIYEWQRRAGAKDEHFLDIIVGCHVGASMEGIELAESKIPRKIAKRRKLDLSKYAK